MKSNTDMIDNSQQYLLKAENIFLNYRDICALNDVTFKMKSGEIHCIIGEHGAGKSSLIKVVSGQTNADKGSVFFDGRKYPARNLKNLKQKNISIIHQNNPVFKDLSIVEYFYINKEHQVNFLYSKNRIYKYVQDIINKYELPYNAGTRLRDLKEPDQIFLDLLKHIFNSPALLIIDEALEKITNQHLNIVLDLIKNLKSKGTAIIIITHRLDFIVRVADHVSVLRDGNLIYAERIDEVDQINLIQMAYTAMDSHSSNPDFFKILKYNEAILRKLPVNIIVIDSHYKIKIVNDTIESFSGMSAKKLTGLNASLLFKDSPILMSLINNALINRTAQACFESKINLNKQEKICKINTLPIMNGPKCIGVIILLDDITEQEQLRQKLILAQNMSSIGLLAAGVAHEINNPLEIMNYLLEDVTDCTDNTDIHRKIKEISSEIQTIKEITRNLIYFSDTYHVQLQNRINLIEVIDNLIGLLKIEAGKKKIRISFDSELSEPIVLCNKTEIRQVFLNLFKNSFEAMPDGGEISLNIRQPEESDYIKIIFKDNGPGIDEEIINDVFLPFYSTKKESSSNMGLGLSLSYSIINKHKGRISISNLNPGCEFIMEFPRVK